MRNNGRKLATALGQYFTTCTLTAKSGKKLRIESDGRSGNGFTHWRAVYDGRTLIADLTGHPGETYASVTIARRGNLRGLEPTFTSNGPGALAHAVKFLLERF